MPELSPRPTSPENTHNVDGVDPNLWNLSMATAEAIGVPEAQKAALGNIVVRVAEHDPATAEHMVRVGLVSALIARQVGADERLAFMAGTAHDIGKTEVPLSVLNKPASEGFSDSDRAAVNMHSQTGYDILQREYSGVFPGLVAKVAGTHHSLQRYNPNGVEGLVLDPQEEEIMRIVAIADPDDARFTRKDAAALSRQGKDPAQETREDIERILPDHTASNPDLAADIVDSIAYLRENYPSEQVAPEPARELIAA